MPPRNNPAPNAVRLFNCSLCDKGYPRQVEYENHLSSYDHNHRQRLADMKQLTASNDTSSKPKQGPDMRGINMDDAKKMPGLGRGFTKVAGSAPAASKSNFKKVGVKVGGVPEQEKKEDELTILPSIEKEPAEKPMKDIVATKPTAKDVSAVTLGAAAEIEAAAAPKVIAEDGFAVASKVAVTKNEDADMAEGDDNGDSEEELDWEPYDFTKPTGCDHVNCAGCKTEGIWSKKWIIPDFAGTPPKPIANQFASLEESP